MTGVQVMNQATGQNWVAYNGDSCEIMTGIPDNSIDLSVYSPPFSSLYVYSDSNRDLGNSRDDREFFTHYGFIIREVLRVTKPGRLTCVHTSDIPAMASRDGYIGLKDFPGEVIRAYMAAGWTFVGRILIGKNPQPLRDGTKVLTPGGWRAIETLRVGEMVVGQNGHSTTVVDIPYHGKQLMYRVTFMDGTMIDCGPGHLWSVRTSHHHQFEIKRTTQLLDHSDQYEIPSCNPDYVHRFRSIEALGELANCTCISVAAPDGLFVTEGYVVTHNSQAVRTKSKALLFVQLRKDSADSRPALVDQVLLFKKPGENAVPIRPVENGEMDNEIWIKWAHGIWTDINETETLQYTTARGEDDEHHVCPLQLETIERCIKLYSNPGETVLSPFGGIGSEGYQALRYGRKAVTCELKQSYYEVLVNNLKEAEAKYYGPDLFSFSGVEVK